MVRLPSAGKTPTVPTPETFRKGCTPGGLEQARKVARASGKPIFVVFGCEH
jgi:hypothetical protein